MLKWRQVVIWLAVFILVVDISTSAHCAVARPSRSITVVNDVAEPDNKSKRSTDVSSRVVARPANNAKLVQPDVVSGYTRIFDPCGSGFGTASKFICCPPDKIDECVQQYCADE